MPWIARDTSPPAATAPAPCLQLCRQLLQRGWRVVGLCRQGNDALRELAAAPGAGSLTVVEGIDVGQDECQDATRRALANLPVRQPWPTPAGLA